MSKEICELLSRLCDLVITSHLKMRSLKGS